VGVVWFIKGFVGDWGDHWHDVTGEELEKLEVEGMLERRD
jgi:hypothetical protein